MSFPDEARAFRMGIAVGAALSIGGVALGYGVIDYWQAERQQSAACVVHRGVLVVARETRTVVCRDGSIWGYAEGYVEPVVSRAIYKAN